jgi:hypothetical protein
MAVRPRDLTAVVSGRHARTGARVLPAGEIFDLIFQAPNSLSFLWSQLGPEPRAEVEDAIMDSSALMLDHLTADYPVIDGRRLARSYVASLVLHAVGTLSGTNGIIPMLHVHCCLFAVMDETGMLKLPDEAALYDEGTLGQCDALGEAGLAERMEHLGYRVNRTAGSGGPSFQMADIPQELLDADFWQNTGCASASTSPG